VRRRKKWKEGRVCGGVNNEERGRRMRGQGGGVVRKE
jgi:hypothetical protein